MAQGAWLLSVETSPLGAHLVLWLDVHTMSTMSNPKAGITAQVSRRRHVKAIHAHVCIIYMQLQSFQAVSNVDCDHAGAGTRA